MGAGEEGAGSPNEQSLHILVSPTSPMRQMNMMHLSNFPGGQCSFTPCQNRALDMTPVSGLHVFSRIRGGSVDALHDAFPAANTCPHERHCLRNKRASRSDSPRIRLLGNSIAQSHLSQVVAGKRRQRINRTNPANLLHSTTMLHCELCVSNLRQTMNSIIPLW